MLPKILINSATFPIYLNGILLFERCTFPVVLYGESDTLTEHYLANSGKPTPIFNLRELLIMKVDYRDNWTNINQPNVMGFRIVVETMKHQQLQKSI